MLAVLDAAGGVATVSESVSEKTLSRIGMALNQCVRDHTERHRVRLASALPKHAQERLAESLVPISSEHMHNLALAKSEAQLSPTILRDLIEAVSVRQSWLYRDWQNAIGDMMCPEGEESHAKIMSYRRFETLAETEDEAD